MRGGLLRPFAAGHRFRRKPIAEERRAQHGDWIGQAPMNEAILSQCEHILKLQEQRDCPPTMNRLERLQRHGAPGKGLTWEDR